MARQLIRLLGTRYGLALVLLVLVLMAVGVARAVSDPGTTAPVVAPPRPATTAASATTNAELGDDSVATTEGPQTPPVSAGAATPETVALNFTNAWLKTSGVTSAAWLKGMQPYLTQRLVDLLQGSSPEKVPATGIRGPVAVRSRSITLVEVTVPVTPGTLRLNLVVDRGRWLVDTLDWDRT